MESLQIEVVRFHQDQLEVVQGTEMPMVSVKTICNNVGLDPQKQLKRIKNDPILGQLYAEQHTVGADGKKREMYCLPLDYIPGWLFSIPLTNTMAESTKTKLILYKKECYQVLYIHFFGQPMHVRENMMRIADLANKIRNGNNLIRDTMANVRVWKKEKEEREAANAYQMRIAYPSTSNREVDEVQITTFLGSATME